MDDMTTLLLIPLVVGILTVFVEYFVIVPLRDLHLWGGITIFSKAFAVLTVIAGDRNCAGDFGTAYQEFRFQLFAPSSIS